MQLRIAMLAGASTVALFAAQGARAEVREVEGFATVYPPVSVEEDLEDEDTYLDQVRREADINAMAKCFSIRGNPKPLSNWELLFPSLYTFQGCQISTVGGGTLRHMCWAIATRECVRDEPQAAPGRAATALRPGFDGAEGASAVSPYDGAGGSSAGD